MPREVPNLGFSKLGRKGNGGWDEKIWKVEEHTDLGSPLLFVFLLMFGFVFVVFVFGWQEKSVVGFVFVAFVFGWQGSSVARFMFMSVFVFLGLWFLYFNFVFLDLGLCSCCSCSRHT